MASLSSFIKKSHGIGVHNQRLILSLALFISSMNVLAGLFSKPETGFESASIKINEIDRSPQNRNVTDTIVSESGMQEQKLLLPGQKGKEKDGSCLSHFSCGLISTNPGLVSNQGQMPPLFPLTFSPRPSSNQSAQPSNGLLADSNPFNEHPSTLDDLSNNRRQRDTSPITPPAAVPPSQNDVFFGGGFIGNGPGGVFIPGSGAGGGGPFIPGSRAGGGGPFIPGSGPGGGGPFIPGSRAVGGGPFIPGSGPDGGPFIAGTGPEQTLSTLVPSAIPLPNSILLMGSVFIAMLIYTFKSRRNSPDNIAITAHPAPPTPKE